MRPTPSEVHNDATLAGISVGYRNPAYIADRVFPTVRVPKQSDYYYKFLKGAWFRNEARPRGPGSRASRGEYPLTTGTYSCIEYALAHPVPIEVVNNADAPLRPFETGVRFATDKVALAKEAVVSALCCTAGNWTTSNDAAAGWVATADGSGNTFIADVDNAKEAIRQLIGVYPNRMLMDAKTFKNIKAEYTVLDRIKYGGTNGNPAAVTTQTIAALFELEEVMIGGALYSSAEEVVAGTDFTAVDLWETNATKGSCLLYYCQPAPAIEVPSAGYCFNWAGADSPVDAAAAGGDAWRNVRYWWDSDTKSYIIEASECFDAEVVCPDAGYLFYDTIVT